MVVGYDSRTAPVDAVSFVTWAEIAPGESILMMDADYDGGGDGGGEGTGGGKYGSVSSIVWSNSTDRSIPAGTVIVILDTLNPSATIGTATGTIGLTVGGEQFFLAQGSLVADGSKYYLDGKLLFGVDYEGEVGWGESGESELPGGPGRAQRKSQFRTRFRVRILRTEKWALLCRIPDGHRSLRPLVGADRERDPVSGAFFKPRKCPWSKFRTGSEP